MRASSVSLVGIGLAVFAALAAASFAQAFPDLCEATVEIIPSEIGAVVSSTSGTTTGASGVVTFQKPPGTQAVVNLTATSDNGWPAKVWPQSIVVDEDDRAYFWISVDVPRAAQAGPAGNAIVDARVQVESFACTAPPPDSVAILVRPYVEVFGARIPAQSRHPALSGFGETFDIEVDVMANAPMVVTFDYTSAGGLSAAGPTELLFDPTFTYASTRSITVTVRGDSLQPGTHEVDILVVGHLENDRPLRGHLGYTMIVSGGEGPTAILLEGVGQLAATAAIAGIALAVWHRRTTRRRRAAMANLRSVIMERRGREPPPANARPPSAGPRE